MSEPEKSSTRDAEFQAQLAAARSRLFVMQMETDEAISRLRAIEATLSSPRSEAR